MKLFIAIFCLTPLLHPSLTQAAPAPHAIPERLVVSDVRVTQAGLLEAPSQGDDRLPLVVEADVVLAQDPTIKRTFLAGLTAHIFDPEGDLVAEVDDLDWEPFALPAQGQTLTFEWDPVELDPATHPATRAYTLELTAHLGVELRGGAVLPLDQDLLQIEGQVERAAAIQALPPGGGAHVVVADSGTAADGIEVDLPQGAVAGAQPSTLTIRPLTGLPASSPWIETASAAFEIELKDGALQGEITLTLPYDKARLAVGEAPRVSWFQPETHSWEAVPVVAFTDDQVSVRTNHLSVWTSTTGDFVLKGAVGCAEGDGCLSEAALKCGGSDPDSPCPSWWEANSQARGREFYRVRAFEAPDESESDVPERHHTLFATVAAVASGSLTPTELNTSSQAINGRPSGTCVKAFWGQGSIDPDATDAPPIPSGIPLDALECGTPARPVVNKPLTLSTGADGAPRYSTQWTQGLEPGWHELVVYVVDDVASHSFVNDDISNQCSKSTVDNLKRNEENQKIAAYECLLIRIDPRPGVATSHLLVTPVLDFTPSEDVAPGCAAGGQACAQALNEDWEMGLLTVPEVGAGWDVPSSALSPEELLARCEGMPLDPSAPLIATPSADGASPWALVQGTFSRGVAAPSGGNVVIADGDRTFVALRGRTGADAGDADRLGTSTCSPLRVDLDHDGYYAHHLFPCVGDACLLEDCDDSNPDIHPDALEICDDGRDNDCDGVRDEGDRLQIFEDHDRDGHGSGASSEICAASASAIPRGYSLFGDDCDDSRDDVFPGAEEALFFDPDGALVDTNCDGAFPLGVVGGLDLDGDGRGDALRAQPSGAPSALSNLIDFLGTSRAHLGDSDLAAGYYLPRTLALGPGSWRENLNLTDERLGGLPLTLLAEGPGVSLDAGGEACTTENLPVCAAIYAHAGARLTLGGLNLTRGRGVAGAEVAPILDTWAPALGAASEALPTGREAEGSRWGGALLITDAQVTAARLGITDSKAHFGAGVAIVGAGSPSSPVVIHSSRIADNRTLDTSAIGRDLASGALLVYASDVALYNNDVEDNVRSYDVTNPGGDPGAGLAVVASRAQILSNRLLGNSGAAFSGLAVINEAGSLPATVVNNTFEQNAALWSGGAFGRLALPLEGSGASPASEDTIIANAFSENLAASGAGLAVYGLPARTLSNNLFVRNLATASPGGLLVSTLHPQPVYNNTFDHNQAQLTGDGATALGDLALVPLDIPQGEAPVGWANAALRGTPAAQDPAAKVIPSTAHPVLQCAFAPRAPLEASVGCDGGDYEADLLWETPYNAGAVCGSASDWTVVPTSRAPFVFYDPDFPWYANDYHLALGYQDTGFEDDADLSDLDGSPGDVGIYGGPQGARGPGAFYSLCMDDPMDLSGMLLARSGALAGALTLLDPGAPDGGAAAPRRDVYVLWLDAGEPLKVDLRSDLASPDLMIFAPDHVHHGSLSWPAPPLVCDASEARAIIPSLPLDEGTWATFTPTRSGYYTLVVEDPSAGLGPYALSWQLPAL